MEKKSIRCYYCGEPLTFHSFDAEVRCPICESMNARPLRFPDTEEPALPRDGVVFDHVDENGELMARIEILPDSIATSAGPVKTDLPLEFVPRVGLEESAELARAKNLTRTDCSPAERLSFADVYLRARNAGDANAQYKLGMFYLRGKYVSADAKTGMEWLNRAAASGSTRAREQLKELGVYSTKESSPSNAVETDAPRGESAASLPEDASSGAPARQSGAPQSQRESAGDADESSRLARMFFGDNAAIALEALQLTREDLTVARRISFADAYVAAMRGDAAAQFRLGALLRDGEYTDPNPALAREWLQKAADQGNEFAQRALNALPLAESKPNGGESEPGLTGCEPNGGKPEPGLTGCKPNGAESEPGLTGCEPNGAESEPDSISPGSAPRLAANASSLSAALIRCLQRILRAIQPKKEE